jgi:hypothetical protein
LAAAPASTAFIFLDGQDDDDSPPVLGHRHPLGSGEIDQPSEAVRRAFSNKICI